MRSATMLLIKDELIGFSKSKVMLVLWVILPIITVLGYYFLPQGIATRGQLGNELSVAAFMSMIQSSLAGTVAALMVAVDIVSEKNRKVYELFVIRPIKRSAILMSKFIAVFTCVTIACIVSILLGIVVDTFQGEAMTGAQAYDTLKAVTTLTFVIALSAAVGVFFGVVTKTILLAVILILYVGQNLVVVPMLPMFLGVLPNQFWFFMLISLGLVVLVLWFSAWMFKRSEF
jgi:ABC-2 type transport system permease protein